MKAARERSCRLTFRLWPPSLPRWFLLPLQSYKMPKSRLHSLFLPLRDMMSTSTQCVFALSSTPPSDPSSASSTFKRHSEEGSFSLTLRSATGIALSTTSNSPSASPSTIRTQAQSTYCYDASLTFCVVAVRDEVVRRVSFTMYSSYSGWMGIGTGSQMQGSIMFVAWKNSRGQMVLSQRAGSGHGTPYPIATTFIQEISPPSSVTLPVTASMSVTFSLASNNTILSLSSALPFIFATSNISPSFPDDPTSNFPQHTLKGTMSLDLSQLGSVSAGASTNDDAGSLQLWHGILMFFAWGVLPFALIFIARYLKTRLGHSWFRIHAGGFMLGVGGLTALSLLLIELQVSPGAQRFLDAGPHGVLGLVLCFVLLPTQVLLGVLCNILYRTLRRDVPWWDQVHWWCGRGVVVAALVQLQLGLNTYGAPAWATVLLWVWVAVVLALFLGVGEMLWGGVVHHVAKAGSAYPFPAVRRGPVGLRYAGSTEMVPVLCG
ncbi:hypothetical protein BC830DRAFT_1120264 [Chytriomyces sp. MP71]|nr:hypothetical protein BC830DRAFT_1120264 [Chytriomyces sp. MP71]